MIYIDSSVALAHLLAEDRSPPAWLWSEALISSRLIEYEMWVRIHARGLADTHAEPARAVLARLALIDLSPLVLTRATERFPLPVRTLDALHLASFDYLRRLGQKPRFATCDERQSAVARAMGAEVVDLD